MSTLSGRLPVLDVWVDQVNMDTAVEYVSRILRTGKKPHVIFAVNPEKSFSVQETRFLCDAFREADRLIPRWNRCCSCCPDSARRRALQGARRGADGKHLRVGAQGALCFIYG